VFYVPHTTCLWNQLPVSFHHPHAEHSSCPVLHIMTSFVTSVTIDHTFTFHLATCSTNLFLLKLSLFFCNCLRGQITQTGFQMLILIFHFFSLFFSHYRAMHFSAKRGIAIACRLSVCLSVCPSVTLVNCDHRLEFFENNFTIS